MASTIRAMIDKPFSELVHAFAAKTPSPGGGAAAAMSASMGIALLLMSVRFTRGKKAALEFDRELAEVETRLSQYVDRMLPMAERDCAAFGLVSRAYGLPKGTDKEVEIRTRAIDEGMIGAIVVPEETLFMVRDVLSTVTPIVHLVGRNIISDMGTGARLLVAGAESSFLNVRINTSFLNDRARGTAALESNTVVLTEIREAERKIRALVDKALL